MSSLLDMGLELTDGATATDDTIGNATVGADASVAANENVLFHLAAVAQTDSRPSVDIVARVGAALSLLVREVGLRGDRVHPPPHNIRRHRIIHEEVGHTDAVAISVDMHVYLVAQNLCVE